MNIFLVILFTILLIYLCITERYRIQINLLGMQGLLLFILAILELESMNFANIIFVAAETLIFKVIVVPYLLIKIIKKTSNDKIDKKKYHELYSLLSVTIGLVFSIVIAYTMKTVLVNITYFIASLFGIFAGLFIVITHKQIISHIIGFLVIENAVFLLSIAIGKEMPMLINIAILLDIFASVLILGLFALRLKQNVDDLTILKDE